MIKSIRLENFQSHKNTTINFCDGVNAIVGLSDSGKTAILRALRWVVTNKPTGDAFQSYWGGDTSVTIILGDGTAITRKRTKSDNLYVKDDKEYRAFGQDVPEDIRKAFDLNDINLQGQMDAPFLLSQSPGEVAQILNKVVNLDVIDKAISSIRKQKLKADGDLKSELTRVSQLEGDLEKFAYLDELETEISGLESLDVLLGKARVGVAGLQAIVREISRQEQRIAEVGNTLLAESMLADVLAMAERRKAVGAEHDRIDELLEQIEVQERRVLGVEKVLGAEKLFSEVSLIAAKLPPLARQVRELKALVDAAELKKHHIRSLSNQLAKDEEEFHELMPEQCPLCGQEVK